MYAITAYDRALIDEAIAAGAVRHIPLGVSGINMATNAPWPSIDDAICAHEQWLQKMAAQDVAWRKGQRQRLTLAEQHKPHAPIRDAREAKRTERRNAMAERNQRIAALKAQGLTFDAVALAVGMSKTAVWKICTGG